MSNEAHSPYLPIPMHVLHAYYESNDRSLKTLELSFDDPQDAREFFAAYNPGQFCLLSVIGKGESALGIASAAWEGDFVRFTIQKMGSVTTALHELKPGDPIGIRGTAWQRFPRWKTGRARTWSSLAAVVLSQPYTPSQNICTIPPIAGITAK